MHSSFFITQQYHNSGNSLQKQKLGLSQLLKLDLAICPQVKRQARVTGEKKAIQCGHKGKSENKGVQEPPCLPLVDRHELWVQIEADWDKGPEQGVIKQLVASLVTISALALQDHLRRSSFSEGSS